MSSSCMGPSLFLGYHYSFILLFYFYVLDQIIHIYLFFLLPKHCCCLFVFVNPILISDICSVSLFYVPVSSL